MGSSSECLFEELYIKPFMVIEEFVFDLLFFQSSIGFAVIGDDTAHGVFQLLCGVVDSE